MCTCNLTACSVSITGSVIASLLFSSFMSMASSAFVLTPTVPSSEGGTLQELGSPFTKPRQFCNITILLKSWLCSFVTRNTMQFITTILHCIIFILVALYRFTSLKLSNHWQHKNSPENSCVLESNRFSRSQEIPCFLQKLKGDYHVQRSPPLIPIDYNKSKPNPPSFYVNINFYIILQSKWNSIVSTVTTS